jgi:hypothetical protein
LTADHDCVITAGHLRQALSQDKRPISFFLGAGCPMSISIVQDGKAKPLIPDIAGMTAQVFAELSKSDLNESLGAVLKHFEVDGKAKPNIEEFLSHVRLLRQVAGNESVRGLKADKLEMLDDASCKFISKAASVSLPNVNTPYHHLTAWIGAINRLYPIQLFTTNYDLLAEQALEENRVPYFDGFVGTRDTFFDLQAMEQDQLPTRWARLWKIHGSINWAEDEDGKIHRRSSNGSKQLIYPSHLKYDESRRMPYLAMLDRLRTFLGQPAAILIVCGYSFGDEHLNEVILQGLQGNSTASAFALMYSQLSKHASAANLAGTRSNLNILARDAGVLGTRSAPWSATDGKPVQSGAPAVTWTADPHNQSSYRSEFVLGDFAKLGLFLQEIIGAADRQLAQAESVPIKAQN